jgi:glycosyltransferase involved in cell wall biosynthesis
VSVLPGYVACWSKLAGNQNVRRALAFDLKWAATLFRASKQFDAVYTTCERASWIFALMQRATPRKPKIHLQADLQWNPPISRARLTLKRALFRVEQESVSDIVVYSRSQARRYAQYFPYAALKFRPIPYHSTIFSQSVRPFEGDYVFAGGDTGRDYRTLIKAARQLRCKTIIAAVHRGHFSGLNVPANVKISTYPKPEFLKLMANAAVVIVPLRKTLLHSGGHQTYLNAMAMGKPVVVADDNGAEEYIVNGVSGTIIEPGDVAAMTHAIASLLDHPALRRDMGMNAKETAEHYTPEKFFRRIFDLTDQRYRSRQI